VVPIEHDAFHIAGNVGMKVSFGKGDDRDSVQSVPLWVCSLGEIN
jgi:hypothetical protein